MNSNEFEKEKNTIEDIDSNIKNSMAGEYQESSEQTARTDHPGLSGSTEQAPGIKQIEQIGRTEQPEPIDRTVQHDTNNGRSESAQPVRFTSEHDTESNKVSSHMVSKPPIEREDIHPDLKAVEPSRWDGLYAGFWMRFWAYLLDLIVIGSLNRMIINPVFRAMDVSLVEDGIFSPVSIATAIVFYLYFVLMTRYYGQTIGKMVFGLKVVELSGKPLSWGTVVFREWIGRFISATVTVLYVIVAFTKKKQGLHDLFADTIVIHEPR